MTVPECFSESVRMAGHCATEVADADLEGREVGSVTSAYIGLAQVYATLALAGATADPFGDTDWIGALR